MVGDSGNHLCVRKEVSRREQWQQLCWRAMKTPPPHPPTTTGRHILLYQPCRVEETTHPIPLGNYFGCVLKSISVLKFHVGRSAHLEVQIKIIQQNPFIVINGNNRIIIKPSIGKDSRKPACTVPRTERASTFS